MVACLLPLAACTDDFIKDKDEIVNTSKLVTYTPSVALSASSGTRSSSSVTSYEPLKLTSAEAADYPLYLHTYSHPLGETMEEMASANTRGVQVNSPKDLYDIHQSFGVRSAFSGETHVHEARRVNESGSNYVFWMPKDPHRWPGNEKIQFSAWAPYDYSQKLMNPVYDVNKVSFSYTAEKSVDGKNDAEAQTDLLLASAYMNREDTEDYNYRVPFTFNHALSAVKFAVRDVLKGKVVSITLNNIKSSGDCVYTADDNSLNGKFVWTNHTGSESYSQIFNHEVNDGYADRNDPDKDVVLNDKMPEKTFMLIPQEISSEAEIEVIIEREGVTPAKIRMRGKILDNAVTEWLPGHEYVYTISTTSANWTYVFDVNGSYRNNTEIYMPSPADEDIYKTFVEGGGSSRPYYEVVSYRYRTNNPSVTENLRWEAEHGDGVQYYYTKYYTTFAEKDAILYEKRDKDASERGSVPAATWLTDLHATPLKGNGSTTKERHNISFISPIVTTDWGGDIEMYQKTPYAGNSESNPWDLSTFGGQTSRNTANCYVVDREGWYAIPLYYGNSIKNGAANTDAWVSNSTNTPDRSQTTGGITFNYYGRFRMNDHKGNQISATSGQIPSSYYSSGSAQLLWQDTYNVVENVKLATVNGERMIVFHVNKNNLQQGNALIGLSEHSAALFPANTSDPKIVWSWHIWFNEHWLNDAGVSNAFSNTGFNTSLNKVSQMQQQGDVTVTVPRNDATGTTYTYNVAPYNIGWCDSKNVRYLSRFNHMNFVQYDADGVKKSGKTAELPIIQDGRTIQYRIGNNVYFQFGRKDPFVGFIDFDSNLKPRYGRLEYKLSPQQKSLAYAISHPHELFVGAAEDDGQYRPNSDWNKEDTWNNTTTRLTEFYNLWNNTNYDKTSNNASTMTDEEYFRSCKTIYDPSPAGYMIPPAGFFKIIFKTTPSSYNVTGSNLSVSQFNTAFNGYKLDIDSDHPLYRVYTSRGSTSTYFTLTSTGHRWYANSLVGAGNNFNPQLVYLWSSHVTKNPYDRAGYSLALGLDNGDKYIVSTAFNGRKSMARPVRCVREVVIGR